MGGKRVFVHAKKLTEALIGTRGKQTTAVKRILQSHKTFANHLSDEEAMLALQQQQQQQLPQQNPTTSTDLLTPTSASITTSTSPSTTDPSVPRPPSPSTLASLLAAPPLSYAAARTKPRTGAGAPPQRKFCDMCGYRGRVRCGKCGGRVCGLECRDAHEETGGCLWQGRTAWGSRCSREGRLSCVADLGSA